MNKLKGSLAAKIVAIILLAASCLALCGAVAGIAWLDSEGAYHSSQSEVRETLIDEYLHGASYDLLDRMCIAPVRACYDRDLRFELRDENDAVLAGNLTADDKILHTLVLGIEAYDGGLWFTGEDKRLTTVNNPRWDDGPEDFEAAGPGEPALLPTPSPAPQNAEEAVPEGTKLVWIRMYWTEESESSALNTGLRAYELIYPWRYELIALAVVSFALAVLMFVFLMAAAGHHDASGEVKAGFVEKIPADLLWLIGVGGVCVLAIAIDNFFRGDYLVSSLVLTALCLLGAGLLALLCLMSTAVHLKLRTFLSSCLIWRFLRWCWRWIKAGFRAVGKLLHGLPLVWKWIPVFIVLMVADFLLTASFRWDGDMLFMVTLLKWALLAAAILYLALAFQRLRKGAKAIAAGEESVVIDEKYLVGDLKDHAEDLNHIRGGLSRAVDERMKSERLRTELITNVSHDIKTPLTSIINYVDLLAREEPENEKTKEYVEVLQRQSARLKKLTDDLVEASKASTGNLPVAAEKLELGVLLDQTAGEYSERLAEKNLDLRMAKPDGPVYVKADPRHLWRILDNLMNNIFKYAQPGTRVYLNLERAGGKAALSFRNISAQPLNIRPEELTERFVRGDSARSTEGSGLGLAIAASLAKLQGIGLDLAVDGDLFKVVLQFDEEK